MIMSLKQLWNKPETNFVLFEFYFSFISHVRAALGYVNVLSDKYVGKTQPCIPTVLSDQVLADAVVC